MATTIGENSPACDTSTDIRRLLDAGYQVTFQLWETDGSRDEYFASVTSEFGSRWRSFGPTPGEALRACWPLGQGEGQGGCGHCGGIGCIRLRCQVCTAYGPAVEGTCNVCGYADPGDIGQDDDLEAYCKTCSADVGIFYGHGDGWHHYRGEGTAASPVELYGGGHEPVIAWHPAGDR